MFNPHTIFQVSMIYELQTHERQRKM